ncbi:NAD-dependent dehydratase [Listeria newyorkensis]|uniref:NAD-dependent dehydratase n=1 Tax=Listeria newyorkensis TaxID=1497681 RepID=A0ABX4XM00_9LIST|nr:MULTISPECIES: SDR family oxidoreductase [Listeria]KGL46740.1 NAD-dependent dehydratase [Listeriaceae bacterium FSL A5-0209]KGL37496.1 NAD-dependent dehydratase [Listeria newyorkensis]PNP92153.1 NAD-dependent dehydratase [Listeria newyorkensis]RQW65954.1 SDR family NAD(P)-dependent oxidoreductase [Listeria sp. SHR_NRA_18]WAO20299.1 SDR family oxidoreductase [Listeria newyorkensis]
MNILVIGAHGQIGKQTVELLAKNANFTVVAMIRKEEQREALEQLGAKVIIADLENDFSSAYSGIDTVIFSAGSGGHTGPEKTIAIDQNAAIRAVQYAEKHDISHFIMVSSVGADQPEQGPESLRNYLIAKGNADKALQQSQLNYTIIRPVTLTNEPATTRISEHTTGHTTITRADVALFLSTIVDNTKTYKQTYTIQNGETPIDHFIK